MTEPQIKVSICETIHGCEWQASDRLATLGEFGMGADDYNLGYGLAKSPQEALTAAVEWWNINGKPHSLHRRARIAERKRQIKEFGRWSHERMAAWEKEKGND